MWFGPNAVAVLWALTLEVLTGLYFVEETTCYNSQIIYTGKKGICLLSESCLCIAVSRVRNNVFWLPWLRACLNRNVNMKQAAAWMCTVIAAASDISSTARVHPLWSIYLYWNLTQKSRCCSEFKTFLAFHCV